MAQRVTYYIGGYNAAAPQQNRSELWDGAAGTYTAWDPQGNVTTSRALTAQETSDLAAMDTTMTAQNNAATLQSRMSAAIAANNTYLGLATPTAVQQTAQIARLTKECNALIKMALNQLSDTTGT